MEPYVEQRLIQLLRDSTSPAVPLRDLHCALEAESVDGTGSRTFLEESLRERRTVFIVLEAASPLGNPEAWPPGARSEYERALAAAGLDTGPHVSLAGPEPDEADRVGLEPPGPLAPAAGVDASLRELRASLLRVLHASRDDSALRSAVTAALAGCHDLPAALARGDDPPAPSDGATADTDRKGLSD
jgi:hypothetical protein